MKKKPLTTKEFRLPEEFIGNSGICKTSGPGYGMMAPPIGSREWSKNPLNRLMDEVLEADRRGEEIPEELSGVPSKPR